MPKPQCAPACAPVRTSGLALRRPALRKPRQLSCADHIPSETATPILGRLFQLAVRRWIVAKPPRKYPTLWFPRQSAPRRSVGLFREIHFRRTGLRGISNAVCADVRRVLLADELLHVARRYRPRRETVPCKLRRAGASVLPPQSRRRRAALDRPRRQTIYPA